VGQLVGEGAAAVHEGGLFEARATRLSRARVRVFLSGVGLGVI
jgi:hypothetical protein